MHMDEETQHPLLLISQDDKQFFYNISENRFQTTNILELHNKYIFASSFGWLVLVDINTDHCYLWHPVLLDKIELPELTQSHDYNRCFLSKPPIEPDCHIIFISANTMVSKFCQIGDDQFITQESTDFDEEMFLSDVVSFEGKIYGIVIINNHDYRFVTINFVDKTLELNPLLMDWGQPWDMPCPIRSWAVQYEEYLIESSCGELLLVNKMFSFCNLPDGLDFRVFHVHVDQMKCKELENIGERAIFINNHGDAFCCASSSGIKPNSIYYTVPDSRNLYVYDLDNRGTTASLPCSIARRSKSESYWFSPKIFINYLNKLYT